MTLGLENSEWGELVERTHVVVVAAGEAKQADLEVFEGGRIELSVTGAGSGVDPRALGVVRTRLIGDQEWSHAKLRSKRGGETSMGSAAWIDGTVARTAVLQPGKYRVRVEAHGYLTAEAEVVVRPRNATPLELLLLRE